MMLWPDNINDELDRLKESNWGENKTSNKGSHKCQVCGCRKNVDDFHKHAPSWCDSCERVQTFEKVK